MIPFDSYSITIRNQHLKLLPQKALFWEEELTLVVSDVHLGKAGHFRKNGIPVPATVNDENLAILDQLIKSYCPGTLLFLGDLFHSSKNDEWDTFKTWRSKHASLDMILVLGNHEVYGASEYEKLGITCFEIYKRAPFLFIHDAENVILKADEFLFSGHVHPAVRVKGKGRQSFRVSCFLFKEQEALLPAFGSFTGTHLIKPQKDQTVIGIVEGKILAFSG